MQSTEEDRMYELARRIRRGEGLDLGFKQSLPPQSTTYLKTVVAFANGPGGTIILGVNNEREIVGVPFDDAYSICDKVTDAISNGCVPQISMSATVQKMVDKYIVVIDIFPGNNTPYFLKKCGDVKGTFVRISATSRVADPYALQELRNRGTNRTFDSMVNHDVKITDEGIREICEGLSALRGKKITKDTLINTNIIREQQGELLATNAYALMLNKSPFKFIEVRCGCFKNNGPKFVDQADFECPIYNQVDDAYKFVLRNIKLRGTVRGLIRFDEYELPPEAIRELIVNAIQHRSYVYDNRQIFVAVYEDRLEITSPGSIYSPLNTEMITHSRSVHRNPTIAKIFRAAGLTEGWGSGIKFIFEQCREYGLLEPVIEDNGMDVRVILFRKNEDDGKTSCKSKGITVADLDSDDIKVGVSDIKVSTDDMKADAISGTDDIKVGVSDIKVSTDDMKAGANLDMADIMIEIQ